MSDIFVFIVNVAAILGAVAAIVVAGKRIAVLLFGIGLLIISIAFAANFFYFGPKNVGDDFIDGLRDYNLSTMQRNSCTNSELYRALAQVGIFSLLSPLADTIVEHETFIPVANQYKFSWYGVSLGTTQESHDATIYIRSNGLTDFCVYNAEGL